MAGVAGPLMRSNVRMGIRFLSGLLAGEAIAGTLLAIPAYLLSSTLRPLLPAAGRLWAVAAISIVLAAADLANRTPQISRQVPQTLIHKLPYGLLGVAWGIDLGLLVTTRKTASLIWVAITAGILLNPPLAALIAIGVPVVSALALIVSSIIYRPAPPGRAGARLRALRRASGMTIMVCSFVTVVQAWHG
jgi:hypothetical protein